MTIEVTNDTAGYWYGSDEVGAVDVLTALRHYRSAENAAQRRARDALGVGENAMIALRILIDADRDGRSVNAKEIAERLEITPASTSALVDRLVRSGHVVRSPDPVDRRGVRLSADGVSMAQAIRVIDELDARTLDAVERLARDEARTVVEFLDAMTSVAEHAVDPAGDAQSGQRLAG